MEFNEEDYCTDYFYVNENEGSDDASIHSYGNTKENHFPDNKTDLLIEVVQQKPALWNIRDEGYRNRVLRNKLWLQVLGELDLNENYKGNVRKKWDSLKTGYARSKKSASGSEAKPSYKYATQLSFLDDTREPRCTTTLMTPANTITASGSSVKTCSKIKSNKKDPPKSMQQKFQEEAINILKDINSPKPQQQENKSFATMTCEMIRQDMETLPELEQRSLRSQLFAVVDEAVRQHQRRAGS